jgi:triosephosphate isomerase
MEKEKYLFVINFKTYKESSNKKAIKIAKIIKELKKEAKKRNVEIIACPNNIDLKYLVREKIQVFSQHIDNYDYGAHTGYVIPHLLKEIGVKGSLINHSEHKFKLKGIKERIDAAKEFNLKTIVCAEKVKDAKKIKEFKPDYIAIEPKELIGGNISISTAKPSLITKGVEVCGDIPLLVGAGIKTKEDVKKAIELGAKGILVASGVVKARSVKKAILELLKGFENDTN